jgi:hypothetical protein
MVDERAKKGLVWIAENTSISFYRFEEDGICALRLKVGG